MKRKYSTMSMHVCTGLLRWMLSRKVRIIKLKGQSSGSYGRSCPVLAPVTARQRNRDERR